MSDSDVIRLGHAIGYWIAPVLCFGIIPFLLAALACVAIGTARLSHSTRVRLVSLTALGFALSLVLIAVVAHL